MNAATILAVFIVPVLFVAVERAAGRLRRRPKRASSGVQQETPVAGD